MIGAGGLIIFKSKFLNDVPLIRDATTFSKMIFTQNLKRHENKQAQAEHLAWAIATDLKEAIASKGWASIAFSGGSTPGAMMGALAAIEMDWPSVDITLVDERCVSPEHERSNARLIAESILQSGAKANFFPLYLSEESDEQRISRFDQFRRPFDVVHLGMGSDGHTASFFPDAFNLKDMLNLSVTQPIMQTQSASSIETRLTWSLMELLKSKKIYLQITGTEKFGVLTTAISAVKAIPLSDSVKAQFPILAVLEKTVILNANGIAAEIFYTD